MENRVRALDEERVFRARKRPKTIYQNVKLKCSVTEQWRCTTAQRLSFLVCKRHLYIGDRDVSHLCHNALCIRFEPYVGWLVGCFGFNGPLRQYFSLYRAVSQREGERGERIDGSKNVQTTPTRTYCKRNRSLSYCNQNCRTPRHWQFTQNHRTTRPPLPYVGRAPRTHELSGSRVLTMASVKVMGHTCIVASEVSKK